MKLSQFKVAKKNRKLIFNSNSEPEYITNPSSNEVIGEINFKDIDVEWLEMNKNILSTKLTVTKSEAEIFMVLLPLISDIEVDTTLEEVNSMINNPSMNFVALMNAVTEIFDEIKTLLNLLNSTAEKVDTAIAHEEREIISEEQEVEIVAPVEVESENMPDEDDTFDKDINETIDELVDRFSKETDREKRIKLLGMITELQAIRDGNE